MKLPVQLCYTNKSVFFLFKNREWEGKTGPVWEADTSGSGEDIRKGCRG
jgi:hypothetical protein